MTKSKKMPPGKVIKPGENITVSEAESLKQKLYKLVTQGVTKIILDFAGVKTIDPMGLSIMIAAHNTLRNTGGTLALKNVPDEFSSTFRTIRLDQHLSDD